MNVRCMIALGTIGAILGVSRAHAQRTLTPAEAHDRIVHILDSLATRPLPAGDTSVSWTRGPVLYHTVSRLPGKVASSMVRNDRLIGTAATTWSAGAPESFVVEWTRDGGTEISLEGRRVGDLLVVHGSRDTSYAMPSMPWVVADYGFDEQLVPLLERLRPDTAAQQVMAYRPYVGRWDTLNLLVRDTAGLRIVGERSARYTDWLAITADGALLFVYRDDKTTERHPLETSRRYGEYLRLKYVVWPR